MMEPTIELIPIKNAVRSDDLTTLEVLVRITPPTPDIHFVRPPINLGLVLDRSGSMAGEKKMEYAQEAAYLAVEQLLPTDRISITIFDNVVETIAPSQPVSDKPGLARRIKAIVPRGITALFDGWEEGGKQVENNLVFNGLNRVILLSDGLANEGMTDANVIAREVKTLASRGVSTSTMGLGEDYNEDLMQAMGEAGDGNYYFIESPLQLVDIFHTELMGLMANLGQKVTLELDPQGESAISEVLNDLESTASNRLMLPNLIVGMPIQVVIRLRIPAWKAVARVLQARLGWDDPKTGGRMTAEASLSLGSCPSTDWESFPTDPEVVEQVALQMAAKAKKEAISAFDRGEELHSVDSFLMEMPALAALPPSPAVAREMSDLAQLKSDLKAGDGAIFRKRASAQRYEKGRGH
jgi:Ca-activated chloride channel family protein